MLTDVTCKNATSGERKLRKLSDGEGLYLWVYNDGRKYWRFRYWIASKEKSLSLGVYPKTSLKVARERCAQERDRLDSELDPSAERRAAKIALQVAAESSFEAVAREWFAKQSHTWVEGHATDVMRRLEKNLFPTLGLRPIREITAPELLASVRKIEARGAFDLAHRVLQVSGQVFRYGVATGRCNANPVPDLRGSLTPHKAKHQAAVKPKELPALLRAIDTYDVLGDKQTRLALQLLALTFVRTNELISAEWPEFDIPNAMWTVPESRMKMRIEHVVPLSSQALAALEELKVLSRGSKFILPGRNRDRPISNNTMLFALYRLGYKGRMTGHGFRAVASTILNEIGFRPDVVERQLAHSEQNEIRGAYNRAEYLPERRKMMQEWADYLDAAKAEIPNLANAA